MASGKVSQQYRWVLIREECDAFSTKEEAIKQAKRQWTATHPHHRVPYYVAYAVSYIEPEGHVEGARRNFRSSKTKIKINGDCA